MPEIKNGRIIKQMTIYGGKIVKKNLDAKIISSSSGGGVVSPYLDENDILIFPEDTIVGLEVIT